MAKGEPCAWCSFQGIQWLGFVESGYSNWTESKVLKRLPPDETSNESTSGRFGESVTDLLKEHLGTGETSVCQKRGPKVSAGKAISPKYIERLSG